MTGAAADRQMDIGIKHGISTQQAAVFTVANIVLICCRTTATSARRHFSGKPCGKRPGLTHP